MVAAAARLVGMKPPMAIRLTMRAVTNTRDKRTEIVFFMLVICKREFNNLLCNRELQEPPRGRCPMRVVVP